MPLVEGIKLDYIGGMLAQNAQTVACHYNVHGADRTEGHALGRLIWSDDIHREVRRSVLVKLAQQALSRHKNADPLVNKHDMVNRRAAHLWTWCEDQAGPAHSITGTTTDSRQAVSLGTHALGRSYLERMVNGQANVISAKPLLCPV